MFNTSFHSIKKFHFGIDNLTELPVDYYKYRLSIAKSDLEIEFFTGALKLLDLYKRGYLTKKDL